MASIEEMFAHKLGELVELLSEFFLQVQQIDGKLYPGETLVTYYEQLVALFEGSLKPILSRLRKGQRSSIYWRILVSRRLQSLASYLLSGH